MPSQLCANLGPLAASSPGVERVGEGEVREPSSSYCSYSDILEIISKYCAAASEITQYHVYFLVLSHTTVISSSKLYYTVLYYTILYCTVLYYTTLDYAVQHGGRLNTALTSKALLGTLEPQKKPKH